VVRLLSGCIKPDRSPSHSKTLPYYEDYDGIGQTDEAGALIYFVALEFNNRTLRENGWEPIGKVGLLVLSEILTQSYTPTLPTEWNASGLAEWISEPEAEVADALARLECHGFLCSEPCTPTERLPADYRSYIGVIPITLAYLADEPGVLPWTRTVEVMANKVDRGNLAKTELVTIKTSDRMST